MKNLAGEKDCDKYIKKELQEAGTIIFKHKRDQHNEVPTSITGLLVLKNEVKFTFIRAWYYWVVCGDVPLEVAKILYSNAVGEKNVRVNDQCGCPPPQANFIGCYHIDSQEGLNFFVKILKEKNLAD